MYGALSDSRTGLLITVAAGFASTVILSVFTERFYKSSCFIVACVQYLATAVSVAQQFLQSVIRHNTVKTQRISLDLMNCIWGVGWQPRMEIYTGRRRWLFSTIQASCHKTLKPRIKNVLDVT
jgi:hypothetical protein